VTGVQTCALPISTGQEAAQLGGNLFGISPVMWNATAYWENDVTSVRLSYNWVEGSAQRALGNNEGGLNYGQYFGEDRGQFDLSASYRLAALPSKIGSAPGRE